MKKLHFLIIFLTFIIVNHTFGQVELVTNGTFDTDSDWEKSAGAFIGSGGLLLDASSGANPYVIQEVGTQTGKTLTLSYDVILNSLDPEADKLVVYSSSGFISIVTNTFFLNSAVGSHDTTIFVDASPGNLLNFRVLGSTGSIVLDNVSLIDPNGEAGRITNGLQVLYDFSEGSGSTVNDISSVGSALDLTIYNSEEVKWTPNGLYANLSSPIRSSVSATKIIDACKTSNEITMEAWIVPANTTQGSVGPVRVLTLSESSTNRNFALGQEIDTWDARLRTTTTSDNGIPSLNSGAGSVETNLTHLVYTRNASGDAKIYINGSLANSGSVTGDFSNWSSNYKFGIGDEFNSDKTWEGLFYLSAIYSRALSASEVQQNYSIGVLYDDKPIVLENPANMSISLGGTATFNVTAVGEGTLSYQWQKDGSNISGANSSSYTTEIATLSDNGTTYRCVVSNSNGSVNSSSATLFVAPSDERITANLQVLYKFEQGNGSTIQDVSGVGSPLNLTISTPEAVEWTSSGLKINSPASIISDVGASKIVSACQETNEITIEAWVKPSNSVQNGPARIITNSLDRTARNFTFGQEFDDYQVGLRTSDTDLSGNALNSDDGGAITELTHVVYTRSSIGVAKIFVNGVEVARNDNLTGDFSTWNANYRLSVGNELLDQRPYSGLLNLIAIYNRQLQRAEIEHNYNIGVTPINSPSNLVASSNDVGTVNINWSDNSNNEDGFIVERGQGSPTIFQVIDSTNANVTSLVDESVLEGFNYIYRVRAFNEITLSDLSNIDTVSIKITAPTELTAEAVLLGEISLMWTDNSNNEDGYNIIRSDSGADPEIIGSVGINVTSYTDETVGEGIKYTYYVVAFVGNEISDSSNSVSLYSKASFINSPFDLKISLDSQTKTPSLIWRDDSFNEDGFIIERRLATAGANFVVVDSVEMNDTTYIDLSVTDSTSYIYRVQAFNSEFKSDYSPEVFIDVFVLVDVDYENSRPTEYGLSQNYPNPFNPSTTISFNVPEASNVNITIYNMLGQEVAQVINRNYSAGFYSIDFDASDLTSGIYIYSIKANGQNGNNFVSTRKMILMK